jgi:chromosome segregation ATPase
VLTHPLVQRIGLVNLGAAQYAQYAKTGELDGKLRAAFRKMADLRSVMDGHERLMRELEQERKRIHQEQKRIRDNLARIPRDSDLYKRYMKKLNAQEDSLESILSRSENTREAATRARAALTDYIQGLDI